MKFSKLKKFKAPKIAEKAVSDFSFSVKTMPKFLHCAFFLGLQQQKHASRVQHRGLQCRGTRFQPL